MGEWGDSALVCSEPSKIRGGTKVNESRRCMDRRMGDTGWGRCVCRWHFVVLVEWTVGQSVVGGVQEGVAGRGVRERRSA